VRGLEKLAFSIFIGVAHTKKETANLKTKKSNGRVFPFCGTPNIFAILAAFFLIIACA